LHFKCTRFAPGKAALFSVIRIEHTGYFARY
jgi:hypothetical protein